MRFLSLQGRGGGGGGGGYAGEDEGDGNAETGPWGGGYEKSNDVKVYLS